MPDKNEITGEGVRPDIGCLILLVSMGLALVMCIGIIWLLTEIF